MHNSPISFLKSSFWIQSVKLPVLISWLQTITVCLLGTVLNGRWQNELRWLLELHWSNISRELCSFPYSEHKPPTTSPPLYLINISKWLFEPRWPLLMIIWQSGSVTKTLTSESVRYLIPEAPKSRFLTSRSWVT